MIPLYDIVPARRFPFVTTLLVALSAGTFIGWQRRVGLNFSSAELGLIPAQLNGAAGVTSAGVEHLFTYQFLHGGWMHLLGNLWFLWVFGRSVEHRLGSARFLVFYLLCGVAAGLAQVSGSSPGLPVPIIGASGAISGVLGGYLMLYPRVRIVTLVPMVIVARVLAVPAWVFLLIWIGLQVFEEYVSLHSATAAHSLASNVAYLAHIGGFLAGLISVALFQPAQPARRGG
ncbi:MAG: rhomboid family intramembrane serine protease [Verrucomicrobia bacterium]|nr:rhomboid family intramembrane serine protease [Verrucomicrobiota bacterium]MBV9656979.1 rhomboid family intramembrane serine protease [Verrucomicrobiota bacterium]